MQRSSGVLLNISSLPGEHGIGSFSVDALNFAEYIASMGFHWWQILPITTIGQGNSPYSGISAFAGNFLYIDTESLEGLLTDEERASSKYPGSIYLTDYDFAYTSKRNLLKKAFGRIDNALKYEIALFAEENAYWLDDYSLFMSIREEKGLPWSQWTEGLKFRQSQAIEEARLRLHDTIEYYRFEQYVFFSQWKKIKNGINAYGVGIFGDMPIYVCYDSVDVWAHPEIFQLDEELRPKMVAGVPPDYFASEGQLWGNPLYNYDKMKESGYDWLINRIIHNLELYDMLRIDHFRGLYKYWAVPILSSSAKEGKWLDGPEMDLWRALKERCGKMNIVAEDLGCIDDDIHMYLKKTGFPGMRVMQFGFNGDSANLHLPHNYPKNCVGYTGTHDNDTTLGWLFSLPENVRDHALDYMNCEKSGGWAGGNGICPATKAFIRALFASSCDLAIVPMQDLCGYGSDTRMNIPGAAEGNWRYRTNYTAMESVDRGAIAHFNELYGRSNPLQELC